MRPMRRSAVIVAAVAVVAMMVPGIAGAKSKAADSGTAEPLKIGVLAVESGAFASSFGPTVAQAAQARVDQGCGVDGQKVELVVADTQSVPANSLTQIRDLVENKGVFALLAADPFVGTATGYLKENNIPTMTGSWAGNFFVDQPEMFSWPASPDPGLPAYTQFGQYYKFRKGTKLAAFSPAIPPSAPEGADVIARSAEEAGLELVYKNLAVPPSGYDYTGDAQAMKDNGVDSIIATMTASETVRLLAAAKQAGVKLKAALVFQGFDQSTLDSPEIAAALEGVDMQANPNAPSANKPAKKMVKVLNKAGMEGKVPTFGAWNGWASADMLCTGLEKLGTPVESTTPESRAALIDGMRQISDYDMGGILAGPYDMTLEGLGTSHPSGNCVVIVHLNKDASDFTPIRKKPFCGEAIPGTEVVPN